MNETKAQTAGTKKKIADALRKCKPYLWDGVGFQGSRRLHICGALGVACVKGGIRRGVTRAAQRILMDRLDAHGSVANWLAGQGHITQKALSAYYQYAQAGSYLECPNVVRQIQQHRHAWVDALINEFEEKPDANT